MNNISTYVKKCVDILYSTNLGNKEKNTLINKITVVFKKMTKDIKRTGIDEEDLYSSIYFALLEVKKKFNVNHKNPASFINYSLFIVKNRIIDAIRTYGVTYNQSQLLSYNNNVMVRDNYDVKELQTNHDLNIERLSVLKYEEEQVKKVANDLYFEYYCMQIKEWKMRALILLKKGWTKDEIARQLNISTKSVQRLKNELIDFIRDKIANFS